MRERNEYINKTIKKLPVDANFVVEDLRGLKKSKKDKEKTYEEKAHEEKLRSKLHYWNYRKVLDGIRGFSEVVGVQCLEVPPAYTSQTLSGLWKYRYA